MKTCIFTLILACTALFSLAQTVAQAEYFIDKDKGFGKNNLMSVTLAADNSFTFTAHLSGITPGYHKLYIRTKASNNKWSQVVRKNIEVFSSATTPDFTTGEYFFDSDPGTGNGKKIAVNTSDTSIIKTFSASTTGLSFGYHKLYIRARDSAGRWGIVARKNVEIIRGLDTAKITSAEYFFSGDPGFGKATKQTFATPQANGTFQFTIPYNTIPAHADTLFVRLADTHFEWSLTKLAKFSGAPTSAVTTNGLLKTNDTKTALLQFDVAVNPNPVKGDVLNLYIQHTKPASLQLAVYSLDGKKVLSQQFNATGSSNKQLNVGTLSTGTYLLQLSDGMEVCTALFIKE